MQAPETIRNFSSIGVRRINRSPLRNERALSSRFGMCEKREKNSEYSSKYLEICEIRVNTHTHTHTHTHTVSPRVNITKSISFTIG